MLIQLPPQRFSASLGKTLASLKLRRSDCYVELLSLMSNKILARCYAPIGPEIADA